MNDLLARLKDVLTLEFETLTNANLDQMQHVLDEKLALISAVQSVQINLPADLIKEVRLLTERNNALYIAALDGLTVARDRLDALQEAQKGLTTYGNDGRRVLAAIQKATRETRA